MVQLRLFYANTHRSLVFMFPINYARERPAKISIFELNDRFGAIQPSIIRIIIIYSRMCKYDMWYKQIHREITLIIISGNIIFNRSKSIL